jgi:hypothetical protein
MPEVQKPVLEHAAPETQEKDLTGVLDGQESCKEFAGIKSVTISDGMGTLPPEPISVPTDCMVWKTPANRERS